jgi:hypothetical protein
MTANLDSLLTVSQAARKSSYLSEGAIRSRIARGEIPVIRLGSSLFIEAQALEDFLKQRGVK